MKAFSSIPRALLESKLAIALFAGVFLALVIFFSASPQFSFSLQSANDLLTGWRGNGSSGSPVEERNDLAPESLGNGSSSSPVEKKNDLAPESPGKEEAAVAPPPSQPPLKPICDLSDPRYDGCEMWGDARTTRGANRSRVYFIPPPSQLPTAASTTWTIRSQSRKYIGVREVLVHSLNSTTLAAAPNCTLRRRSVAGVVFAVGGLTFNYWHAFSDVLVPLFTTARAFGRDVELLATDTGFGRDRWFLAKYRRVFAALSRFEVVRLDDDDQVRCYPHLLVGLRGHRDFDIDPARTPAHYDMFAFRLFVREAYSLPPPETPLPFKSGGNGNGTNTRRPRAMVILRGGTRRFVNPDEIVAAVERAGFEAVRMEPTISGAAGMDAVSRAVDACDVLVGAHGAGLTNMVFLRTGGVAVQVVPWGKMEPHAEGYFGQPAKHMGVRHVAYSIAAEESTLYETYGKDSPVITDPDVFYRNGTNAKYYWREQNIRLNTTRFMPTLELVKRMLQE